MRTQQHWGWFVLAVGLALLYAGASAAAARPGMFEDFTGLRIDAPAWALIVGLAAIMAGPTMVAMSVNAAGRTPRGRLSQANG